MNEKKELFKKLCEKTGELGRKVSRKEALEDEEFPNPNEFSYHYGSFATAAEEAYRAVYPSKKTPPKVIRKPVLTKVDHTEYSDRPQA